MTGGKYAIDPSMHTLMVDVGLSPAEVLRRAGLRADMLSDGAVWVNQDEFFRLWRAIEAESGNPNLPLLVEHVFAPGAFAPPIFAALASPDLNVAVSRVAVYKKLIGPVRVDVSVTGDHTTVTSVWPNGAEPPAVVLMSELLFWVELARTGTRQRVHPLRITAPQLPEDQDAYRAYLGIDIEESSEISAVFSSEDASRRFLTSNDWIWETFEPSLRRQLNELEADAKWTERVRATLLELLPVGRTTVAEVATELAMSSRTLHRRLQAETTTFQRILDGAREELATHYLARPELSARDISFLLGYEETSSFYRAFQNWTGETPERARERIRAN